jgi:hypothetical protein
MESFRLPIEYEGEVVEFETRIVRMGYIYRFAVMVHDKEYFFERDEEGAFRALIEVGQQASITKKESDILMEISISLGKILD